MARLFLVSSQLPHSLSMTLYTPSFRLTSTCPHMPCKRTLPRVPALCLLQAHPSPSVAKGPRAHSLLDYTLGVWDAGILCLPGPEGTCVGISFPPNQTTKSADHSPTGGLRWGWVELRRAGCGAHIALVRQDVAGGAQKKAAGCSWRPEAWLPLCSSAQVPGILQLNSN